MIDYDPARGDVDHCIGSVVAHVVARERVQSRARASEPTSIEDVLQEDLVMHHTSPKERVYCITIPFVLKASSHVELVQAAATCQLRLRDGARGRALSVSQSVSQLFHGPAPRSPLHRLAVRLRHSRRAVSGLRNSSPAREPDVDGRVAAVPPHALEGGVQFRPVTDI